jgi:hypothetical protein
VTELNRKPAEVCRSGDPPETLYAAFFLGFIFPCAQRCLSSRDSFHRAAAHFPCPVWSLELSELDKLGIDQGTLMSALYGDLQMTIRAKNVSGEVESEFSRRRNGFFTQTTRVSAVVVERTNISNELEVAREVFPTHNAEAVLLTRAGLECFGTLAADLAHLYGPA